MLAAMLVLANLTIADLGQTYLKETFNHSPMIATIAGYNQGTVGSRLDDLSPRARSARIASLKKLRGQIQALAKTEGLSAEDRADARLLLDSIALELIELEEAKEFSRRPDMYVGPSALGGIFFNMAIRNYAPLEQRAQDVASRLGAMPHYLDQAQANLNTFVEVFRDAALRDGEGLAEFLEKELIKPFANTKAKVKIEAALPTALSALRSYLAFVKGPLAKKKQGDFRWGSRLYGKRFGAYLQIDWTPADVLARAEKELAAVRAEMVAIARPLYLKLGLKPAKPAKPDDKAGNSDADVVKAVLDTIAKEHGTADKMLEEAKKNVADERAFIEKNKLLTLPPRSNLDIFWTPPFMRSQYGVAGFDGAPPLTRDVGAFYYITPFPAEWTPSQRESQLREYNRYKFELISIHEAMPGHYVQLEWANQVDPEWRRTLRWLLGSTSYVEGWACFAEHIMLEQGYLKSEKMRLVYLKATLRALANAILDIKLHTANLSDEAALKLMMEDTFQERSEAELKLRRAKLSVTQLCSYFVGFQGWLDLREKVRKAQGPAFNQRDFLDRALREGSVALSTLEAILLDPAAGAPTPGSAR